MFIIEDKMETASLFIQKVAMVLSGTASQVTVIKAPPTKGRVEDIN